MGGTATAATPCAVAGTGELQFTSVRGATALTRALAVSPLKILNPKNAGASAWTYLATYGGGLLGGDALSIDIAVGRGARALVATQASTKVYRSEHDASQRLRARADDDSLLVLLPDPVTCFAGSRYTQEQHVHLEAGASLVLLDWLTAGRIGSGERWQFERYRSQTRVWQDDRLILQDGLTLSPEQGALADRLDRFNCLAMAVLLGPALRVTATQLVGSLAAAAVPRRADLLVAAAPLGDEGALVRVAGVSVEQVGAALRQYLAIVPTLLGDDPWRHRF